MSKKLILILISLSIITFSKTSQVETWKKRTNKIISKTLSKYHYKSQDINDNFSKRMFTLFLNRIDPNKIFLTEANISKLKSYEYKIDNDIRNETFHFFNLCLLQLKEQALFSNSIYHTLLKTPIDLNKENLLTKKIENKTYSKNNEELRKQWKITIQHNVAQNYIKLYKEKFPSANTLKILPKLEIEARLKTKKDLERRFKRLIQKTTKDYFSIYLDCITSSFGPHTSYLPPEEKQDFDINMSGQLEGIGAVLREEDGYIKVVQIIPGSASWRQGLLKAEDIILKVTQANSNDAVSIIETPVRNAVKLIRGPKGSNVTLTIKKPSGIIKDITITRDIVVIKSTYVKSGIFNMKNNKFGYINLPSFYRDFDNNSNRNAADDVKKALKILNKKTTGLILDLRNNGGGSLKDAIDISGFFIPSGPIVQVLDSHHAKNTFFDLDNNTYYEKPLIVLVNSFSASASEIVAAALQDYNRAIIIGDKSTFGKGTVQKILNLDRLVFKKEHPLGYIKITIQEYFRITGRSTQFKGVIPDIIYPNQYDYLDIGEKKLKYAIKGSEITARNFNSWNTKYNKSDIIKKSYIRQKENPKVKSIENYVDFMKNKNNVTNISVKVSDLWQNIQTIKEKNKQLDNLTTDAVFKNFDIILTDQNKKELKKWKKTIQNDFLINEALLILHDIENEKRNMPTTKKITATPKRAS